jgi:hypothetical protein
MKAALRISILLNAGLLCVLIVVASRRKESTVTMPSVIAEATPSAPPVVSPPPVAVAKQLQNPFHWSQLESKNDYRIYVANLRAIGCPEATIRDIVNGDAERGFSFERSQLGLDGSGTGAWSRLQQEKTVVALLGGQPLIAENSSSVRSAKNGAQTNDGTKIAEDPVRMQSAAQPSYHPIAFVPSYPLVFQNVNLDAMGFNKSQKAAVQQVQQQFVNDIGGANQNPNDPAYLARWQKAQTDADDMLRGLLGSQAYMAYKQQQYYNWYEPQVLAASSEGRSLIINPDLFSAGK